MTKKSVAIIGGGPTGMMAAHTLAPFFEISLYEKEKTLGRKFLVAGKGGFNLTNSVEGVDLKEKYIPKNFLDNALEAFGTQALRKWLLGIGIPTYIGTSGRVFPEKGIKPTQVLNTIKASLVKNGVQIHTNSQFTGFDDKTRPIIKHKNQQESIFADYYVFTLGGASWSVTGSDGKWTNAFEQIGIEIKPFQSSNSGVNINWPNILKQYAGKPLKNIAITVNDKILSGEAVITMSGMEGNVVYPLVPEIRAMLNNTTTAALSIDFKPNNTLEELIQKTKGNTVKSKDYANVFNLSPLQIDLLKTYTSKEQYTNSHSFAQCLKSLSITVSSLRPIEEAISTVGGIALDELNADFSLKKHANIYLAGEMLDWDAPTGGFLLQGCFSTAHHVAKSILEKI